MKGEETRNGVRIRKHFATSTKISEDGLFVEKEFIDKQDGNKLKTYNPKIKVDEKGLRYIENKNLGRVYIQDLVADYRMTTIKTLNGGLQHRPIQQLRQQRRTR